MGIAALAPSKEMMADSKIDFIRPRVFLFGNRGYMSVVLPVLLENGCKVVGLCASEPPRAKQRLREWAGRLVRILGLRRSDDFFIYQDPFAHLPDPRSIACRHRIALFASSAIKSDAFAQTVGELKPDIILVAGFPRLIPERVFSLATLAAINIHSSLLPRHRGGTPGRWVVRRGENETGLTAHWLDRKFDTGDILFQEKISVAPDDSWGDVEQKLLAALPGFIQRALALILAGVPPRLKQDEAVASYESSYKGKHVEIDWSQSPEEIRRTCLAIRPKSGGLSRIRGTAVCAWDVAPASELGGNAQAGEIVGFDDGKNPIVRCGGGAALAITETLRNGAIRSGADMAARLKLGVGDVFSGPR